MSNFKTHIDDNGRVCSMCNIYKTFDNFSTFVNKYGTIKHSARCKSCDKIKYHESREKLKKPVSIFIKDTVKVKEDICPELTPEMFGIVVEKEEDLYSNR